VGRAYFSADTLLAARKLAGLRGEAASDRRSGGILVLPSAFAGDVKAIEAAAGVLTAQGGYAAHASVVARQYGTVSLVAPEMIITGTKAVLGSLVFNEGDPITLDAPYDGEPAVYQGAAEITEPDIAASGLFEFIAMAKGLIKHFQIRANAETPADAERALSFGADGIGLCRTEHMFFQPDRINTFRDLILSESTESRQQALEKLRVMQRDDFYRIFKIMAGKAVTIRLLDAPLHEFMPRNADELAGYMDHIAASAETLRTKDEILARIEALKEWNPMLGHRGCRIAVSYPEIYAMQVSAIFEAVHTLRSDPGSAENPDVRPEIMVPLIMNASELKLIAYGKRVTGAEYAGIADMAGPAPYKIGAMIELPAAALGAGDIATYAQFFSFGANDLTQTALGLSRDDAAGFLPAYTRYDLLPGNPFRVLDERVKELIVLALDRGRLTRPDLVCGFCGEQGADPATIRFCMEAGIDYVSCSPYAAPAAILAAAQVELDTQVL
jgi:pyruvate,orthophosphate dikinase